MKNIKFFSAVFIAAIMLTSFQSCEKYPENPIISLVSRAERVSNTWKVDNYKLNGNDYTSLVSGYTETFTKEGAYSYDWGILSGTGTWAFENKDEEVRITGIDNQTTRTLYIVKLQEKEFWYYYLDGTDKHEFHMIEN
ncbi:MAG: hypothetical protein CVU11_12595 [Bacteroidetes bacterium HGW-Bacteroidetes-6]|jgi:hypothetical protein|nr:MAG: hypothetical protein CVU11_12595 [Bacteroidetes bacterium HGW-Bacteroidetes-6]